MSNPEPKEIKIKANYLRYLFNSFMVAFLLVFAMEHWGQYLPDCFMSPSGNTIKITKEQYQSATDEKYSGSAYAATLPVYLRAVKKDYKYWMLGTVALFALTILYQNIKIKIVE